MYAVDEIDPSREGRRTLYRGSAQRIGFEYNDGGRGAAGYRGTAGDCVARATAILTGLPYRDVYKMLAEANSKYSRKRPGVRSARNGVDKNAYTKVFADLGLKKIKLPRGPRPTYTEAYYTYGDCIVSTTKHLAAIVDGKLRDTHDERTYLWDDFVSTVERERKAASIWVMEES